MKQFMPRLVTHASNTNTPGAKAEGLVHISGHLGLRNEY